ADALLLVGPGLGVEAVAEEVMLLGRKLLQVVGTDVVVGHDEAVCRDERPGTARVEANAGFLDMLEPLRRGLEPVLLLDGGEGRGVEEPHALVGEGGRVRNHEQAQQYGPGGADGHGGPPKFGGPAPTRRWRIVIAPVRTKAYQRYPTPEPV